MEDCERVPYLWGTKTEKRTHLLPTTKMATPRTARKSKTVFIGPVNENKHHYQNYNDRTVTQPLDPKETRQQAAFNRYLLCGTFSEVQLVGFDEYGAVVYRVFTSPNLAGQYNVSLTRTKKGLAVAVVDLSTSNPDTDPENYCDKQIKLYQHTKVFKALLQYDPYESDAVLLAQAWEKYTEQTTFLIRTLF